MATSLRPAYGWQAKKHKKHKNSSLNHGQRWSELTRQMSEEGAKKKRRRRIAEVAKRTMGCFSPRVSTIAEIEAAIEKLSPQEQRELAAWYRQREAMLNAADLLFQAYETEEKNSVSSGQLRR